VVRKHKPAAAMPAPVPKKASEKWKGRGGSSHCGTQTTAQELALAKPLKVSKKFGAQSLGLSIADKASPAGVKIGNKKTSSTSAGRSDATLASAHALDLFDSASSASDGKATCQVPP
jgi:hypothetical protein